MGKMIRESHHIAFLIPLTSLLLISEEIKIQLYHEYLKNAKIPLAQLSLSMYDVRGVGV